MSFQGQFMFLDEILKARGIIANDKTKDVSGLTLQSSMPMNEYGDQQALNRLYENIVWAYRCIVFTATNLASVPWKIYKRVETRDGEEKIDVTDDPRFAILRKPNPFQTLYDFKTESYSRLELQGELFWELDYRTSINKILGLYADWRSEEVEIVPDAEQMVKEYKRTLNGKSQVYPAEQIIFLKYFNPYNQLRGMSPLRASRHSSVMELNAIGFNQNFFKQGARPSGIMTTDSKITEPEERRLREIVKNKYQSVQQMHDIMILWGGLKFEPLNTMTMTDMQFKELREMNREEIVAAFGLSLEVLGLGQKTYENVKYYRRLAWTETLIPKNQKLIDSLNLFLIPKLVGKADSEYYIKPDYSGIEALKEDRSQKTKDYQQGFTMGAVTPNEIRTDVFGKDPIVIPEMEMTYMSFNVLPVAGIATPIEPKSIEGKKKNQLSGE